MNMIMSSVLRKVFIFSWLIIFFQLCWDINWQNLSYKILKGFLPIELTHLPPQYLPLKCVLENDLKFLNESIRVYIYIYIYFFFFLYSAPVTRTSKLSLGGRSNTATWYSSTLQSHQTWRKWKGQVGPQFLCSGVS